MVARKRKPLAAKDTNQQAVELGTARDPKTSEASAKAQRIIDDLDARGDSLAPACSPKPNPRSMVVSANPMLSRLSACYRNPCGSHKNRFPKASQSTSPHMLQFRDAATAYCEIRSRRMLLR